MCSGGKVICFSITSEIEASEGLFFELASMARVFKENSIFPPPFKVLFLSMGVQLDLLGWVRVRSS